VGVCDLRRSQGRYKTAFEYLAEGFCWYLFEAFYFTADELLAFYLVIASLVEGFIGFFFCLPIA
jgi:hypothetical protein